MWWPYLIRKQNSSSTGDLQPATEETANSPKIPTASVLPQTSSSAFSASGFGKLATGSSPFASLGTSQSSIFSSSIGSSALSLGTGLGASGSQPAPAVTMPKLTFGSANSASPFANLSSGFGGASLGSPFSTGKGLESFASPLAKPLQSEKPAKPFGAPESDAEEEEEEDAEREDESESNEQERAPSPEKELEEKKRIKLHKGERVLFYSILIFGATTLDYFCMPIANFNMISQSKLMTARQVKQLYSQSEQRCFTTTKKQAGKSEVLEC